MRIEFNRSFSIPDLRMSAESKELLMLWISPGTFTMGSPVSELGHAYEDGLPFRATLSRGFWLGQYQVTQAQWLALMNKNPSHFQLVSLNHPVENVSWYDVLDFCNRLNQLFASDLPAGYHFSLPTQMQWEYACRAGTQTLYYSGNSEADLARVAWYGRNSGNQTHPVGEKEPNAWGLYDMHGNVEEWCYDFMQDYPTGQATDWVGEKQGPIREFRGGAWSAHDNLGLRSASNAGGPPDSRKPWIGFRLCLR